MRASFLPASVIDRARAEPTGQRSGPRTGDFSTGRGGVRGRSTLEGRRYLIQRSVTDHPEFPDAMAVFGVTDEQPSMHYFDSRGVYRVYAVGLGEGTLRFSRDAPEFSQRFTGTFSDDGNTITGLSRLSQDGSTCEDDLAITYRRVA
jgi:hypothetical protein